MKKINGQQIETEFVVYAVEYAINDEPGFVIECDDEEEARQYRAVLDGVIVAKTVYETAYAEIE